MPCANDLAFVGLCSCVWGGGGRARHVMLANHTHSLCSRRWKVNVNKFTRFHISFHSTIPLPCTHDRIFETIKTVFSLCWWWKTPSFECRRWERSASNFRLKWNSHARVHLFAHIKKHFCISELNFPANPRESWKKSYLKRKSGKNTQKNKKHLVIVVIIKFALELDISASFPVSTQLSHYELIVTERVSRTKKKTVRVVMISRDRLWDKWHNSEFR